MTAGPTISQARDWKNYCHYDHLLSMNFRQILALFSKALNCKTLLLIKEFNPRHIGISFIKSFPEIE